MAVHQIRFSVQTPGRGTSNVTAQVNEAVHAARQEKGIVTGLCHVFCHHTSASLILCENADPVVRRDLESFMSRLVPDGDPIYQHTLEGPDDMPAHVRMTLTQTGLSIPVSAGRCGLGTWQGVYLWEHRTHPQRRNMTVTISGEA